MDETDDESPERPAGSKGVGIANALASLGFGAILGALIVVGLYTYLTIYAIVKALGSAPDDANPVVALVGLIAVVTLSVAGFAVAVSLIGRTADPKRRR